MAADIIQVCQEGQVVLCGGAAVAASIQESFSLIADQYSGGQRSTINDQRSLRISRGPSGPSYWGKEAKFGKLRNTLMTAGLVQVGQEGQVVFGRLWPPAFRS